MAILAYTATEFCNSTKGLFDLLGLVVLIIKILIPIALIIFGMLDMGKAVTSGKDDEIKKQVIVFLKRAIGAVLVFFVPTMVGVIMQAINSSMVGSGGDGVTDYTQCITSITGVK